LDQAGVWTFLAVFDGKGIVLGLFLDKGLFLEIKRGKTQLSSAWSQIDTHTHTHTHTHTLILLHTATCQSKGEASCAKYSETKSQTRLDCPNIDSFFESLHQSGLRRFYDVFHDMFVHKSGLH